MSWQGLDIPVPYLHQMDLPVRGWRADVPSGFGGMIRLLEHNRVESRLVLIQTTGAAGFFMGGLMTIAADGGVIPWGIELPDWGIAVPVPGGRLTVDVSPNSQQSYTAIATVSPGVGSRYTVGQRGLALGPVPVAVRPPPFARSVRISNLGAGVVAINGNPGLGVFADIELAAQVLALSTPVAAVVDLTWEVLT